MRAAAILVLCAACSAPSQPPLAHRAVTDSIELVPPPELVEGARLDWLVGGAIDHRVAAWSYDDDATLAQLELAVFDDRPAPLQRWAVRLARTGADPTLSDDEIAGEHNYYATWIDEHNRRNAEWGWVGKGERLEIYDRFVATGDRVWHVRLTVHGKSPPAIRRWLTAAFDDPFGTRPPPQRRLLEGEPPSG